MRKGFIVIFFIFFASITIYGVSVNDVAPSSDLYPYVAEMIQNNIMKLDSSGNFNGTLIVTRADLARILSRLLNYVQGRVQPLAQVSQSQPTSGSATSVAISNDLSLKIQNLEDAMKKYSNFEAYVTNTSSSLNEIVAEIDQLKTQVNAMQNLISSLKAVKEVPPSSLLSQAIDDVKTLNVKVNTFNAQISQLKSTDESMKTKMGNVSTSMNATVSRVKADIINLKTRLDSVESERQVDSEKISSAVSKLSSATSKMESLSKENVSLKKKVSSLESTIGSVYFFQAIEAVALIGALVLVFMK